MATSDCLHTYHQYTTLMRLNKLSVASSFVDDFGGDY